LIVVVVVLLVVVVRPRLTASIIPECAATAIPLCDQG
jgi:hypothetical protein